MKKIFYIPFIIVALSILFYLQLVLVYLLPTEPMNEHMVESSSIFQREGTYPRMGKRGNSQKDNYTDAIMLLTASFPQADNAWIEAIKAKRLSLPESIVGSDSASDMLVHLYQKGNEGAYHFEYARYWHGYLVFLKPLLLFFNYGEIKMLIKAVQLVLFSVVLFMLWKRNWPMMIPLVVTAIFMNVSVVTTSLQFNSVIMITLFALLFLLIFDGKVKKWGLFFWGIFFLICGSLTSYIDLLTFPLISLGIPLSLWIVLNFSEKTCVNIIRIIYLSVFWGIGYGGTWASKWILGAWITKENIIADAMNQMITRTSSTAFNSKVSYLDVIIRQIDNSLQSSWALMMLIACVAWMMYILIKKQIRWNLLVTLAFIGIYPFLWFFCLKNHSYIHGWFTYRELAVSIFAMLSYIMVEITGIRHRTTHDFGN